MGVLKKRSAESSLCSRHTQGEHEYDDTDVSLQTLMQQQDSKPTILADRSLDHFLWTTAPQPHAVRRRCILAKYPEIEKLYGYDRSQSITTFLTIGAQIAVSYYVSTVSISWISYLLLCFVVSGTLNHSLFAAMHEGCHRTIFPGKISSESFCIAATIPMGVPAAIPFKRYHLDHHIYMGVDGMDPDLPTEIECRLFRSLIGKLIWMMLLPATYSLRPIITRPKNIVFMDVVNWCVNFVVDSSIAYFWGIKSIGYLLIGTFFSMSFHPFAGHFLSEHFIWPNADAYQETYSYYGVWNYLTYNLGHHIEHHDFPRIPGSKLNLLKKIAPEFYATTPHTSWPAVTWSFILMPSMSPFNRIKRVSPRGGPIDASHDNAKLHAGWFPNGGVKKFWPRLDCVMEATKNREEQRSFHVS